MLAYGYPWDSAQEQPDLLREASLVCTRGELDTLIAYLQEFRVCAEKEDHRHYRDQDGGWDEAHSDFIIFLTDDVWTKENRT